MQHHQQESSSEFTANESNQQGILIEEDKSESAINTGLISGELKESQDYNSTKLVIMLIMVGVFFLAELIFGLVTSSLTLLSDSFHMLSDFFSLLIGLFAILLAKRNKTTRLSYGWGRAEILGGLINGVFLLSVDFFIFLEAIQRFFSPEAITKPVYVLVVGGLGLAVNIIGLFMFGHHHHPGHDHDHDHSHEHNHAHEHEHEQIDVESQRTRPTKPKQGWLEGMNVNMLGVFLHIFGDFLGSIAVMVSASIIYLLGDKYTWPIYIDPALSLLIAILILFTTIPLVKNTCKILLQGVPSTVNLIELESELLAIEGIKDIHELHVWQLVNTKHVGSVHIVCSTDVDEFMDLAKKVQQTFHEFGVHSTTIQPEFETHSSAVPICQLQCGTACADAMCCPPSASTTDSLEGSNQRNKCI